jgi:uncharacterized protein YneF (UPF0154 family)
MHDNMITAIFNANGKKIKELQVPSAYLGFVILGFLQGMWLGIRLTDPDFMDVHEA